MSADSTISCAFVDAELWFIYLSNQSLTQQNQSNFKWHDYPFKSTCSRQHFLYLHSCIATKATQRNIACHCSQYNQSIPGITLLNQTEYRFLLPQYAQYQHPPTQTISNLKPTSPISINNRHSIIRHLCKRLTWKKIKCNLK